MDEYRYAQIFHSLGYDKFAQKIQSQKDIHNARIDHVIETDQNVVIFEVKVDKTMDQAMN